MPWTFSDGEEALGLLILALRDHQALLPDKPRAALAKMQDYCEQLGNFIERQDGLLQSAGSGAAPPVEQPRMSTFERRALRQAQGANQSCVRGVHAWGPIDHRGWATCTACGQVSITGGSEGKSGAFAFDPAHPIEMP